MAHVPEVNLMRYRLLRSVAVQYEALEQLHRSLNDPAAALKAKSQASTYREKMREVRDGVSK